MHLSVDSTTSTFYLLHYPVVRFQALLIHCLLENTPEFVFIDKDHPDDLIYISKHKAQNYLKEVPEVLNLLNHHHRQLIQDFGINLINREE